MTNKRIKLRHSDYKTCEKCHGLYVQTRGEEQKLCLNCVKLYYPEYYENYPISTPPEVTQTQIEPLLIYKAIVGVNVMSGVVDVEK